MMIMLLMIKVGAKFLRKQISFMYRTCLTFFEAQYCILAMIIRNNRFRDPDFIKYNIEYP